MSPLIDGGVTGEDSAATLATCAAMLTAMRETLVASLQQPAGGIEIPSLSEPRSELH
jgi:hypothetical protein